MLMIICCPCPGWSCSPLPHPTLLLRDPGHKTVTKRRRYRNPILYQVKARDKNLIWHWINGLFSTPYSSCSFTVLSPLYQTTAKFWNGLDEGDKRASLCHQKKWKRELQGKSPMASWKSSELWSKLYFLVIKLPGYLAGIQEDARFNGVLQLQFITMKTVTNKL